MIATAIVFEADRQVRLRQLQLPEPTADDLVVRVTATGVSVGTERWALVGKRPEMKYPHIPGYLGVGVIEKLGSRCRDLGVGQRVFFYGSRLPEPYASNSWMGVHLSRAVVRDQVNEDWAGYVCRIPEGIADATATQAGLAAVSARGADMLKVTSRDIAVVLGLGMIGQFSAQFLRAKGARVIAADIDADRVRRALAAGCDAGVVLDSGPIRPQLARHLPERGADIVVDTTSVARVVQQLPELLRMGGQILFQGYYPGLTPVNFDSLHAKRPSIQVACAQSLEAHEYAHRLIRAGMLKVEPLITHRVSPNDAPQVYQMILDRPHECLGIVFDWSDLKWQK